MKEDLGALLPEVDYQALVAQMPGQSHPRRKIKELQTKGHLIRLKKGFYVFSRDFIGRDYSSPIVANLLYGPSYVSLESALAHYGLIPERVPTFTSVTTQKNKSFETPIGLFTYRHLHASLFPLGVTLKAADDKRSFVVATPEKALMDIFVLKFENSAAPRMQDVREALEDDLRLDLEAFSSLMNRGLLQAMKGPYRHRRWNKLVIDFLLEAW